MFWLWQGSEHAWELHRALKMCPVLNMPGLKILQGCEYEKLTQGSEYKYPLIMVQYPLIWLKHAEYAWICLNMPAYARVLNVSDAVHSIRSLYKLLSSYRDRGVFNTVKYLRWSLLQKE